MLLLQLLLQLLLYFTLFLKINNFKLQFCVLFIGYKKEGKGEITYGLQFVTIVNCTLYM